METLKKTSLLFMFFIINYSTAQTDNSSVKEREAFLMGMFNHYSGDIYIPDHPILKNRLTFFLNEKEKMLKIFKDSISVYAKDSDFKYTFKEQNFLELYNLSRYNPFEKYYKKIQTNNLYSDSIDDKEYKIYALSLQKKAFRGKKTKLLFLAGAFLNNGEFISEKEFSYRGKPLYIDFIISILEDMKFQITEIEFPAQDNLGGLKKVHFYPSSELREVVLKYNTLKY